ncbi:MAG: TetR/AcrR family transcriptional regulator [Rhodospirillales bacterium]|nr:TetR/AcrR family transcriptional regulator [Rhodospirillales bacterium]
MARRGRPRSFDRGEALQQAKDLFWALGYEGVTLTDLQEAMGGITAPSFYAAFGSKEELFREAVELHRKTEGAAGLRGLTEAPTARASIEGMLHAAANSFCQPGKPRGCLIVLGAINCARANRGVQDHLRDLRRATQQHIRRRLERGVAEGDLPAGVDIGALTSFYTTVLHGLAVQARDGAGRKDLHAAVDGAMAAWDGLTAGRGPDRAAGRT